MHEGYRGWLAARGLADASISTRISDLRKVEAHYGPLDTVIAGGGFAALIEELTYSKTDERAGRPNPSRLPLGERADVYNNLASYKGAANLYARYLDETGAGDAPRAGAAPAAEGRDGAQPPDRQRLALERDMQTALRRDLAALEPGLTAVDDGAERAVPSGFIDILARDARGRTVVIELKAGRTDSRVIGQILGYMGDIAEEDPDTAVRGIIVAHDFDRRTLSAARAVPDLALTRYAITFAFRPVG